jgi:hypothetical protein
MPWGARCGAWTTTHWSESKSKFPSHFHFLTSSLSPLLNNTDRSLSVVASSQLLPRQPSFSGQQKKRNNLS